MAKLSYKMSYYALYVCFAVILVVLGMFFLVGYNNPVGDMNAPEHTETLIYLMYALFGVTVGLTVIAAIAQFGAALKDNPMGAIKSLLGLVLLVHHTLLHDKRYNPDENDISSSYPHEPRQCQTNKDYLHSWLPRKAFPD